MVSGSNLLLRYYALMACMVRSVRIYMVQGGDLLSVRYFGSDLMGEEIDLLNNSFD